VRAELYALRGDRRRAEVYADSARKAFAEQLRAAPEDAQRHVFLGLSLAYLGQKDDAIREGLRGVELMPVSRDGFFGPYVKLQLVRIYLLIGEPEQAIDQLEPLLHIPFYVSPGWLRVDPTFNSLRTNPRFRKLVEERR
jgi:tetratricopeptide (TPR) repeat protein